MRYFPKALRKYIYRMEVQGFIADSSLLDEGFGYVQNRGYASPSDRTWQRKLPIQS
jgi:hypothetical protein